MVDTKQIKSLVYLNLVNFLKQNKQLKRFVLFEEIKQLVSFVWFVREKLQRI